MMILIWLVMAFLLPVDSNDPFRRRDDHIPSKVLVPQQTRVTDKTELIPKWKEWSSWSDCTQDCNGKQHRTRGCNVDSDCVDDREERDCNPAGKHHSHSTIVIV